ncbi:MAG: MbtH family NRPS accessory protein [Burkholderiaceae bacterium]
MSIETKAADELYEVVVNPEEQYSIWVSDKAVPAGWNKVGFQGTKDACLAHIKEIWVDMRPLSLRNAMAQQVASLVQ